MLVGLAAVLVGCSSSSAGGFGDAGLAGDDGGAGMDGSAGGSGGASGSSSGGASGSSSGGGGGSSSGGGSGSGGAGDGGGDAGCGEFTGDTTPTCSKDGNSLGVCASGVANVTPCPNGCLREPSPQASICMGPSPTNFGCSGSYGTVPVDDGNYYLTSFGCYIDANGNVQTDPGDNCIPSCLSKAIQAGLCPAGSQGPDCEEAIDWYTADGARFGCLARVRVTNPANGKAVIAVALDYGPSCSVENGVNHAVLDASGRIDDYLFGGPEGASDMATVHVVQVDDSTPLGPI